MMTTMAALLGRRAADARQRHRLGAAPAARLRDGRRPGVSQVLTLYTTPVVYLYLDRLQAWLTGRDADTQPAVEGPRAIAAE